MDWKRDEDKLGAVNTVYSDFRKELVASGMAAAGFDPDRIFITRRTGSQYDTGKEITGIRIEPAEGRDARDVFISTNRPGIYDSLPEGLFHTSITKGRRSKESILHEIKVHREEEFYARRFFSLYETEIERTRVDIQSVELSYDKPYRDRTFVSTLAPFWPVVKKMDLPAAIVFVKLIPFIHRIRDSFSQTAEAMTMILGDKVEIRTGRDATVPRQAGFKKLGQARLGVDMLTDGVYGGVVPVAKVMITPEKGRENEYLPGRKLRTIAESLADMFIPARYPADIVVSAAEADRHFNLGDSSNPCILGINTILTRNSNESKKQQGG